jgi:hypothetical protein
VALLALGAVVFAVQRPSLRTGVAPAQPTEAVRATAPATPAPAAAAGATLTDIEAAQAAVDKNPDNPQAYLNLASAYYRGGLTRLGLDQIAKAAEVGANDAAFLRGRAEDFRAHRNWLPAAIFYTSLAGAYGPVLPNDVREGLHHTVYMAAGLEDSLFPIYIPFDRLRPIDEPLAQIAETRYAITRSLMPGNLPVYDDLLASRPNLADVRLLQAEIALRREQPEDARAILTELTADPAAPRWVQNQAEQLLKSIP